MPEGFTDVIKDAGETDEETERTMKSINILLEFVKCVISQHNEEHLSKQEIIQNLTEHGLTENEIKFILEATCL